MTDQKAPHWLQLTSEIPTTWTALTERFGADRIDAICTTKWHELGRAVMANALNLALDQTGLSVRKKRRVGIPMLKLMFMSVGMIFMFGYAARMDEEGDDADKA